MGAWRLKLGYAGAMRLTGVVSAGRSKSPNAWRLTLGNYSNLFRDLLNRPYPKHCRPLSRTIKFLERSNAAGVKRLPDVRLNTSSQLADFAKNSDLACFLRELCAAEYVHEPLLAPSQALLDGYKKHSGIWADFECKSWSICRSAFTHEKRQELRQATAYYSSSVSASHSNGTATATS